ncbi:hypothetical protein PMAYCL1PPCAC_01713, partial [Pristionchus mayeri]
TLPSFCSSRTTRMSGWTAYIDNLHASTAAIKRSAIVGYPSGDVWARSEGANAFAGTAAELATFVKAFDNINDVPGTGADLEGTHYIVPRTEENLIFGKKDRTGFFAVKTAQAVLIAVYEGENSVSSEVRVAVEKLADYLKSTGY